MTQEQPQPELHRKVRSVLVDLVAAFIKERPGCPEEVRELPVEKYAAQVLDPLFKDLARVCLSKKPASEGPANPVQLVQEYVRERSQQMDDAEKKPPPANSQMLGFMESWCARRDQEERAGADAKDEEIAQLNERIRELEASSVGPGKRGSLQSRRNSGKAARRILGGTCLALMLRKLHEREISSASDAFMHFSGDDGGNVVLTREALFKSLMDPSLGTNFNEDETWSVVDRLDPEKSGLRAAVPGSITFDEFKAALLKFLAQSQDFHSSFSEEEFNAVMARIGEKLLEERQISLESAFREFDSSGEGTLDRTEFIDAITKLDIGLSPKESAQLFYAMDVDQNQVLTVDEFVIGIQRCMEDNPLKGWASEAFLRLAEDTARKAVEEEFQREANGDRLDYEGFIALLSGIDPGMSQSELSRLWCVLDKRADESTGAAYVVMDVLLANMGIGRPEEEEEGYPVLTN